MIDTSLKNTVIKIKDKTIIIETIEPIVAKAFMELLLGDRDYSLTASIVSPAFAAPVKIRIKTKSPEMARDLVEWTKTYRLGKYFGLDR